MSRFGERIATTHSTSAALLTLSASGSVAARSCRALHRPTQDHQHRGWQVREAAWCARRRLLREWRERRRRTALMSTGARPNEAEPAGLPLHRHGQRTAAPAGRPFTFTTRAQTSIQFGFRHTTVMYTHHYGSHKSMIRKRLTFIFILFRGGSTQVSHTHAQVTRTRTHPARRLVTLRYTPPIPTITPSPRCPTPSSPSSGYL